MLNKPKLNPEPYLGPNAEALVIGIGLQRVF